MKFLLDVNALIAWWHSRAPQHAAFHSWVKKVGIGSLSSCAHVELGFIRVSMQVFGYTRTESQDSLAQMKMLMGKFIAEAPSPNLAAWAKSAPQTSDAYLSQLAQANGLLLATFDRAIPKAAVIS